MVIPALEVKDYTDLERVQTTFVKFSTHTPVADPGGGPRGPWPPLAL